MALLRTFKFRDTVRGWGQLIIYHAATLVLSACSGSGILSDARVQIQDKQLELLQQYEQCVNRSNANPKDPTGDPNRCDRYRREIEALKW